VLTRRDCIERLLIGVPLLLGGCRRPPPETLVDPSAGRLHARPGESSTIHLPSRATPPRVQPLVIGGRRDGAFYVSSSYRANAPAPLIVFLHGAGSSGREVIEHLTSHADQTGSVVVAPDSREDTWSFGSGDEAEDVAFIDDTLEAAFSTYPIDPLRIGIGGFSDGASAALSLGLVNGDLFSAICAFSPGFIETSAPLLGSPRIFISHGSADDILPVERCGRRIASALQAAGYRVTYREFEGGHTVPPEIGRAGLDSLVGATR